MVSKTRIIGLHRLNKSKVQFEIPCYPDRQEPALKARGYKSQNVMTITDIIL